MKVLNSNRGGLKHHPRIESWVRIPCRGFFLLLTPHPQLDLQILGGIELSEMARPPWEDTVCIHSPCKLRLCVIC